jgi:hypothetical protein
MMVRDDGTDSPAVGNGAPTVERVFQKRRGTEQRNSEQNCFGTEAPAPSVVRLRSRLPSPPARTSDQV